jgi:hypothetical protein
MSVAIADSALQLLTLTRGDQVAGLPDYDYGPQALNSLSLQLYSGELVLNAADIHIYAKDSSGDSTIDLARWEFIAILVRSHMRSVTWDSARADFFFQVSAIVSVIIMVSTICFGVLLFLRWRERRRYTEIEAKRKADDGQDSNGDSYGIDEEDCESKPPTYEFTGSSDLVSTENTALLPATPPGHVGSPAKAKEVLGGERAHHPHQTRPQRRSGAGQNWKKQIQIAEIKILGRIGRGSYGDVFKGTMYTLRQAISAC